MNNLVTTEKLLSEIEIAYFDIPFANSDFQNKVFVSAAEGTPARAYRHIGLRMFNRITAIKELKYNRELEDIDIEEKQYEIDNLTLSSFDKRRRKIEIEKILSRRAYTDKLLNDAINELNCLYHEFKKFPKYTREQFEAQEEEHFVKKLTNGNSSLHAIETLKHFDDILLKEIEHVL